MFTCAFLTACYTGMRTGEVFALTWEDIDLDNRIIKINKTVYAKDKEKKGRWYLGTTKTVGSCREVYICDTLYLVLSNYKKLQNEYKKVYGKKYKQYVLEQVRNKYGKLIEYKVVVNKQKRYIKTSNNRFIPLEKITKKILHYIKTSSIIILKVY